MVILTNLPERDFILFTISFLMLNANKSELILAPAAANFISSTPEGLVIRKINGMMEEYFSIYDTQVRTIINSIFVFARSPILHKRLI